MKKKYYTVTVLICLILTLIPIGIIGIAAQRAEESIVHYENLIKRFDYSFGVFNARDQTNGNYSISEENDRLIMNAYPFIINIDGLIYGLNIPNIAVNVSIDNMNQCAEFQIEDIMFKCSLGHSVILPQDDNLRGYTDIILQNGIARIVNLNEKNALIISAEFDEEKNIEAVLEELTDSICKISGGILSVDYLQTDLMNINYISDNYYQIGNVLLFKDKIAESEKMEILNSIHWMKDRITVDEYESYHLADNLNLRFITKEFQCLDIFELIQ